MNFSLPDLRQIFCAIVLPLVLIGVLDAQSGVRIIDDNGNAMSDVWEVAHGAPLNPDEDTDGDGYTNREEAAAGTNPRNPLNFLAIREFHVQSARTFTQKIPSVAGIHYETLVSADLKTWLPVGPLVVGTGSEMELTLEASAAFVRGGALRSRWNNFTGGVSGLKTRATNGTAPDFSTSASVLDFPQTSPNVDNFGQWIRGWIIAPATGSYRFWIASDDASEFLLSTNKNPANKVSRASVSGWTSPGEWTKYPSQQSPLIPLTAGQAYYFEIFHQEWTQGDHLALAWTRPGLPEGSREIIAGDVLSPTGQSVADLMGDGAKLFFRMRAFQGDFDGDGVSDFEERVLGLDPANPTTTPRLADVEAARRSLTSPSSVTLGVANPRGYEASGEAAEFVVFRSGGIRPITVPYTLSGSAVAGEDFLPLAGQVHFPAGARSVKIPVTPIPDGITEIQETVTLTLQDGAGYELGSPSKASATIDDAVDVLFVAQLRGTPGGSAGSGTGAVRRAGNALNARVSLSFGGLGSEQTGAEIFYSLNGAGGPAVFSFPLHQAQGLHWDFAPAGGLTRTQIIAALESGQLWVRVLSAGAGAEITGQLVASPGWQSMPTPVPPPPTATTATNISEAARFLTQATFGPSEPELAALVGNSYSDWIDAQLAMPASYHRAAMMARQQQWLNRGDESGGWQGPRNEIWWQRALTAPDQLRQRMAFALSQIFVISQFGALDIQHEGVTLYYDMLLEHAFGNYRDLLENATLSPMMGTYLSMMRNRKPDPVTGHEPDENYAREVMQLFSVGLSEMHLDGSLRLNAEGMPIPTYTQNDTVGLAHVFTGWGPHYNDADPPRWSGGSVANRSDWFRYGYDPLRKMSCYENFHDNQERRILGANIIPAGADGVARMRQALDVIFQHPNIGPFIAKQLIQKFVTSNPSPAYVSRVASVFNDDGTGERGDLGATIKAVLTDFEARNPAPRLSLSYGKPSEPVMRLSRTLRVLPGILPRAAFGDPNYYLNTQYSIPEQAPLLSSSVFNFYQPGYSNPGPIARAGLLSPEFQIFAETNGLRQANFNWTALTWGIWTPERTPSNDANHFYAFDLSPLVAILNTPGLTAAQAQERLIDHFSERFLFGAMSPQLRGNILATYAALPSWYGTTLENQMGRVRVALYLILNSPEFFVQK